MSFPLSLFLNYYLLCFFNRIIEQEGRTSSAGGENEVAQTMYIHVSKCRKDKIKNK
jgi:hypothetical protein